MMSISVVFAIPKSIKTYVWPLKSSLFLHLELLDFTTLIQIGTLSKISSLMKTVTKFVNVCTLNPCRYFLKHFFWKIQYTLTHVNDDRHAHSHHGDHHGDRHAHIHGDRVHDHVHICKKNEPN